VTLLVPGGRGQGDEHRGLAQRGEFGDGSGAAAGDDHVGQGQHVGKFGTDEGGQVVALQQSGCQSTCCGTQRLQVVGTTLVDDVGAGQQPRQEITHGLVDLYRALCATGDIHRGQVRRVPGEAEPFGGPVGPAGQHFRADGVAGDHGPVPGGVGQEQRGGGGGNGDRGGGPGQDLVGQPEADGLFVHDEGLATQSGGQADGYRDVAAGGQHHVRGEFGDEGACLGNPPRHVGHVPYVLAGEHLDRVGGPADLADGHGLERDVVLGGDPGLQAVL